MTFLAERWICLIEGVLAAFVVGLALPDGRPAAAVPRGPRAARRRVLGCVAVILVSGSEMFGLLARPRPGAASGAPAERHRARRALGRRQPRRRPDRDVGGPAARRRSAPRVGRRVVRVGTSAALAAAHRRSAALLRARPGLHGRQASCVTVARRARRLAVRASSSAPRAACSSPLGYRGPRAKQALDADGPHRQAVLGRGASPSHEPQASGLAERRLAHRAPSALRLPADRRRGGRGEAAPSPRTLQRPDARARRAEPAARHRARLRRGAVARHARGASAAGPRDPRRRRPGDRRRSATSSTTSAPTRSREANSAPSSRRCAPRSPGWSASCGCRSSTCAARSRPTAGLGRRCPTTCGWSAPRSGLTVHLTLDESPTRLRNEVETELLRITQEAVTNARKHSSAENLWVRLPGPASVRPHHGRRTTARAWAPSRPDSYGLTHHARARRAHRRARSRSRNETRIRGRRGLESR